MLKATLGSVLRLLCQAANLQGAFKQPLRDSEASRSPKPGLLPAITGLWPAQLLPQCPTDSLPIAAAFPGTHRRAASLQKP